MGWVSPTGHNDPNSKWSWEENAYDDNTSSLAGSTTSGYTWTAYLELTIEAINCSKIRYYANQYPTYGWDIDVDVYKDDEWVDVYQGSCAVGQWVEKSFNEGSVTKARVRFYNTYNQQASAHLYEFDFWKEPATYTKTVPIDLLLRKLGDTETADLDARLVDRLTKTLALSALIAGIETETLDIDALVQALADTETADVDVLLQALGDTATADLDARLVDRLTSTANLSVLLRALADGKTVSLDLIIGSMKAIALDILLKTQADTETISLDTYIASRLTDTVALDARVVDRLSSTPDLDVMLKALGVLATVALDAKLKGLGITDTADLDAYIRDTDSETADLDLNVAGRDVATVALDMIMGDPRPMRAVKGERPTHRGVIQYRGGSRKRS